MDYGWGFIMRLFTLLLIVLTATLLTGCCLEDHTKTIRKVAEPMFKELKSFYKQNKRYPNLEEQDTMYKKSGCEMKGNICTFKGEDLTITRVENDYTGDYNIRIKYIDKSIRNIYKQSLASCNFGIYENGKLDSVGCSKRPCLEFRQ